MKKVHLAIITTENGKNYAHAWTIRTGENLLPHIKRFKTAKVFHLCESRTEAEKLVTEWNAAFKANGTYLFDETDF